MLKNNYFKFKFTKRKEEYIVVMDISATIVKMTYKRWKRRWETKSLGKKNQKKNPEEQA